MGLLDEHAAVPVLLRARQAAAAVLQPAVVQPVACYDVARLLLQLTCRIDKRFVGGEALIRMGEFVAMKKRRRG